MAVRSTMAAIITRTRVLINDPLGPTALFDDQTIQDVMDEGRVDLKNVPLIPKPLFTGSTIQYLDYYSDPAMTDWEDGTVFKQYLTVPVVPTTLEPIAGHWAFATSTLPPIYATGSIHDIYRASADLLERLAARWVLRYDAGVDGQTLRRNQVQKAIRDLAHDYRTKQRPRTISTFRSDLASHEESQALSLGAKEIDYMSSGNG